MPIPSTLPTKILLEIHSALSMLDNTQTAPKNDECDDVDTTSAPFRFSGKTRWNIAKNTAILKRVFEAFVKDRDAVIDEISGGAGRISETDEAAVRSFNVKINEVLDREKSTQGLLSLSVGDLDLDTNLIPTAVLAALEPIISE